MDRHPHHTLTAVFERCDEGGFHAFFKEIPGVHSEGDTIAEAKDNLFDALQLILSYRMEKSLEHHDVSKIRHFEAELAA